jgi:Protein of unknown function (DUF3179)
MNYAFKTRYLWMPIVALLAVVMLIVTNSTLSIAQDAENCSPNNINTNNWSTDFCTNNVDFNDFLSGGPPKDGIPSVTNPVMESIEGASEWLSDRSPVVAVEIEGEARAYPLAVLMWHEIANDEIAGIPFAVTFCPLCNSSIAYDRRVDGTVLDFGVSGLLLKSNLVMFDRETESWWQQLTGEGLVGNYTDTLLDFIPSRVISFGAFAERYPDGTVMSRETGFNRRYGVNPYTNYDSSSRPFLFQGEIDDRLSSPVDHVLAIELNDIARAYPFDLLREEIVVNDTLGETPVVIFFQSGVATALGDSDINNARDIGTAGMYKSTVGDQVLTFTANGDGTFTDEQTGSLWDDFGGAIDGELVGTQLEWVNAYSQFWFAWAAFRPETEVYGL